MAEDYARGGRWWSSMWRWGWGGSALAQQKGPQAGVPLLALNGTSSAPLPSADAALGISAFWSGIHLGAVVPASLPFHVYRVDWKTRKKELAAGEQLYDLFHTSPNRRMTPMEFWTAMYINRRMRGNAYARIDRASDGSAIALWPLPAEQVEPRILDDGTLVYLYRQEASVVAYAEDSILHIKGMGNGIVGLSTLDYMRATLGDAAFQAAHSMKVAQNGGKVSGVLMVDHILKKEQREQIRTQFRDLEEGNDQTLLVLEANMKYQQTSLSPSDMQLLDSRKWTVDEIGRWLNIPSVLLNQSTQNMTTGLDVVIDTFFKTNLGPEMVNVGQAIKKRVFTDAQRARYDIEADMNALLRASAALRYELYAKAGQNGLKTRNELRALENDPPLPGGDDLTVQVNLVPLQMLGQVQQQAKVPKNGTQDPIAQ